MKAEDRKKELQVLITRLLENIAEINILSPDSKEVGDMVIIEDEKLGTIAYGVSRRIMSEDGSWVLASRDEPLWNEVVAKLAELKPNTVSAKYVEKELDNLVWQCKSKEWKLSDISQDVAALIGAIEQKKVETRGVILPIWGLVVKVSPFVIGDVEFEPAIEHPEFDEELRRLEAIEKDSPLLKVHTIAVTEAKGSDGDMILQNAEAKVNRALNILRPFTYATVPATGLKQIGIMGTYYTLQKLYAFEANYGSADRVSAQLSGWTLSGIVNIVIDEYLTKVRLANTGFHKLSNWLVSVPSGLDTGLLRGAELLGEATKPDTLESKFLKVALAVDAMIGEESSEHIPDRGIRARIAERSAFLLANSYENRRRVYDEISTFVQKRNKLAHGAPETVSQWETERFGLYAREILVKLLLHAPPFKDTDELGEWVLRKSFEGGT